MVGFSWCKVAKQFSVAIVVLKCFYVCGRNGVIEMGVSCVVCHAILWEVNGRVKCFATQQYLDNWLVCF